MKVSVIVSTYNRSTFLKSAIDSILSNTYPDFGLTIVDQSENNETKNLVNQYKRDDNRIKYLRSEKGKSRALNLGIKETEGEIIALTDDDCIVPRDWIEKIVLVFRLFPDAAIIFGDLIAREHDSSKEFIPEYFSMNKKFSGVLSMKKGIGKGANMAIKKSLFEKVGCFDENLGPGMDLRASEDWDFTYRTLAKGLIIYDTDLLKVKHLGSRNLREAIRLAKSYHVSTTAFLIKNLRCGDVNAIFLLLWIIFIHCRAGVKIIGSITKWPLKIPRFLYGILSICRTLFWTVIGVLKSFQYSVDKEMRLFVLKG
jgi:glycosyltransferase involved in cell wall biosynthesis